MTEKAKLIARYEGRLLAFVQRRLNERTISEDVVQETFIGFLNSLPNFDDRRELLMRLTEDVAELLYSEADAWWSGEGDGPTELAQALRQVIALYRDHDVLLRAVVEAASVDDAVAGFWRALVGRFIEASRRRIEAEQAAGRIGPMPADEVAFALSWMTERTCYQRLVQGGDLDDVAFTAGLVRVWTGALYGRA